MKILIFLTALIVSFLLLSGCPNPQGQQAPLPDLTVAITPPVSTAALKSAAWPFSVRVTNVGTSDAPASSLEYRIANDAVPAGPDIVIIVTIPIIAAGAFIDTSLSGSISANGLDSGTNHVTVTAASSNSNKTATASLPVIYDEINIDTYHPSGSGFSDTRIDLYGASDLATPLASADSNTGFNPDQNNSNFPYIHYLAGLAPGDYYVRILALIAGTALPYVIRAATTQETYTSPTLRPAQWIPGSVNTTDVSPTGPSYENDDNSGVPVTVPSGGQVLPPTLHISDVSGVFKSAAPEYLNRYISAGTSPTDVDWVKLTLR